MNTKKSATARPKAKPAAAGDTADARLRRYIDSGFAPADPLAVYNGATCPAGVELVEITALVKKLHRRAKAWIDAGHGSGCGCPYCSYRSNGAAAAECLTAVSWTTEIAGGLLDAIRLDPPDADLLMHYARTGEGGSE